MSIPEYAYRFTQSVAKFEMIMMDVPRTDYDKDEEEKHNNRGGDPFDKKMNPNDKALMLNQKSLEKLKGQEGAEWTRAKLSDI